MKMLETYSSNTETQRISSNCKVEEKFENVGQLSRQATMEIAVAGEILGEFFAAEVFGIGETFTEKWVKLLQEKHFETFLSLSPMTACSLQFL